MNEEMGSVLETLCELQEDINVPKNIKEQLANTVDILESEAENSIKINKALGMLDEISENQNLQAFTRTQLWNISSILETINS